MKSPCMLRRLFAVVTLCLVSAVSAHAWEGKVNMTMTTSGKHPSTMPVVYYIKDLRMRAEMTPPPDKKGRSSGTFVMLMDWKTHEALFLMPEQKMYFSHQIDPESLKSEKDAHPIDFKPTGRKEKIAGYDAEEYAGTSEGKRTEVWVTKGMGQFMMASQSAPGRKTESAQWEKFMRQGDFFPLRTIIRDKEGAPESFRMEATSVEKGSQPDSLFQPPADYKKFEMPNLGGALKGLIPGSR